PPLRPLRSRVLPYTTLFRSCRLPHAVFSELDFAFQEFLQTLRNSPKGILADGLALGPAKVGYDHDRTVMLKQVPDGRQALHDPIDRKSTRLNSSHVKISYAV